MAERVRSYHSPLRAQQAKLTRERILQAAREIFRQRGYGATTLGDIARVAGVAEPTVRAVFKTKTNLVEHLLRLAVRGSDDELQLQQQKAFRQVLASANSDTLFDRLAELAETVHARSWDVHVIVRGAASSDPAIAELYEQRVHARHANQAAIAERLKELGALRDDLDVATAADLLWMYTSTENYRMLVIERKWSTEQYRAWFRAATKSALT
jgi:TetR/AcrR family transcriptional regulator of autoinduction and epiphytic fitness